MLVLRAAGARVINGPKVVGGSGTSISLLPPGCEGVQEKRQVTAVGAPRNRGRGRGREVGDVGRKGAFPLSPGQAPRLVPRVGKVWSHWRCAVRVLPHAVPSAGSMPPSLPGQDKGSLTRDGTAPHKWDWSEREPETERERRERQGPRELGEATVAGLAETCGPTPGQAERAGGISEEIREGARLAG